MPPRLQSVLAALAPLLLLGAVALAVAVINLGADSIVGWVGAAVGGTVVVWILAASLWPAKADRTCPSCGEEALERLDPDTTMGLRCTACGHTDPTKSGWFLAEDEGPLEELALRQRAAKRAQRAASRSRAGRASRPSPPANRG